MGRNVLVQEALTQFLHRRGLTYLGMLSGRIPACLGLSNDPSRLGPGLLDGDWAVGANRHFDLATTTAAFDDVGLSAGWAHTNAEAR